VAVLARCHVLSTAEWRQASEVIREAHKRGADSAEDLDRRGMLLTARRGKQIQANTLHRFAEELRQWRPDELLRKVHTGPWTPAEMLTAVHMFLDEYMQALSEEET